MTQPDDLDLERLFLDQEYQAESEALTSAMPRHDRTVILCSCGRTVDITWPAKCPGCGDVKSYWRKSDGGILKLSNMTLGHLNNTIRFVAAKLEQTTSVEPNRRQRYEIALDLLYAELGSRDKEISQVTGILSALTKNLAKD